MDIRKVDYEVNGRRYTGYLADGSGGKRTAGVLVAHEGGGMTEHPQARARMLAELGYVAFAMDTFGEPITHRDQAMATIAPRDAKHIRCKVMVCLGAKDPIIPAEQRAAFIEEMTAGNVDWQMLLYANAGHSFTNREVDAMGIPGFAYDDATDKRSWHAMRGLFDEVLGPV